MSFSCKFWHNYKVFHYTPAYLKDFLVQHFPENSILRNMLPTCVVREAEKLNQLQVFLHMYPKLKKEFWLTNYFLISQVGYSPLVWIKHKRKLKTHINGLHKRTLSLVCNNISLHLSSCSHQVLFKLKNISTKK